MKKGRGTIKLGGFELICFILFCLPLLFLLILFMNVLGNGNAFNMMNSPMGLFLFSGFIIYVIALGYNVYNPHTWIKMDTKKKWKLCAILSIIAIILHFFFVQSNTNIIGRFISGFISSFIFLTGANALVLMLQGKATFSSKAK